MDALGVAGDVSSAGAALAGPLLAFMGSVATSYESYQRTENKRYSVAISDASAFSPPESYRSLYR